MASLSHATLVYIRHLKEAGMPEHQAEIHGEFVSEIIEGELATKRDLAQLKIELELKLANLKTELLKWTFGALIAQGTLIVACIKLLN